MSGGWGRLEGIRPVKLARFLLEEGVCDPSNQYMRLYGATEEYASLACEIARRELNILKDVSNNDIGLYIGIPFCRTRCLYCSFVTNFSNRALALIDDYLVCLKKELEHTVTLIRDLGLKIRTVYIGGGTPTILSANQLESLLIFINEIIRDMSVYDNYLKTNLNNYTEFTVEAGRPDSLDREKLERIFAQGVNRICINPQTMNDSVLEFIGRRHTSQDIIRAFNDARDIGFTNINMDLIAGLPNDTFESFEDSLKALLELSPEGITVHTMSIKRGSRLNENLQDYNLAEDIEVSKMVDAARYYLGQAGFNPYYLYRQKNILGNLENIGYAKPEFESLYNIMIMEEVSTIVAVGAGSVTKVVRDDKIDRIFNVKEPLDYIARIDEMLARKNKIVELI